MWRFLSKWNRPFRGARVLGEGLFTTALLSIGALPSVSSPAPAQPLPQHSYSPEADSKFARGVSAYAEGNYGEALRALEEVSALPSNQRTSAALLLASWALVRLDRFREALEAARRIESDYPGSRYTADARLVAGDCYFQLELYREAAAEYAGLLAAPGPLSLQASAAERLAGIVRNRAVSTEERERIRRQLGAGRFRDALLFGEARWYSRLGWKERSHAALATYLDSVENGLFAALARRTLGGDREVREGNGEFGTGGFPSTSGVATGSGAGPDGRPAIGIPMPLSGSRSYAGEELLAGIQMANDRMGKPFELRIVDTGQRRLVGGRGSSASIPQGDGSSLLRTVSAVQSLARDRNVVAIIGPVFSPACVAASVVAEAAGIPLIAPLAQQSGLDTLGRHIFQLNVVPEVQGRALAEYATLVLGLGNLAVLAPLTEYGWNFHRAFVKLAESNGGDVVHSDWYVPEETTDFKDQFEALRQAGFGLMPSPDPVDSMAVLDSLSLALLDTTDTGEGTFYELLEAPVETIEEPPDSTEIFIDTIDGIAVVVESFDDARTIAAQLRFFRLEGKVLGNDIWYRPEEIRQMGRIERKYVEGGVLVSGRFGAASTRAFTDEFRTRFRRDPGLAVHGYDAAAMLIRGWEEGHQTRAALREWLAQMRGYEGAAGRVSFPDGRRVNTELTLLMIDPRGRVRAFGDRDLPGFSP
ncbi:MAG: ABC transporter substrate-binding protein [Gemmatimonadetes bacterium]|nr:ABC transporter substrate-binding protein [Gemmatimonadota bacterium]